jgi:hypothetical protein
VFRKLSGKAGDPRLFVISQFVISQFVIRQFVILSEAKNPVGLEQHYPSGFFASLRMTTRVFAQDDRQSPQYSG